MNARLIFEDGTVFNGTVFAAAPDCFGEVVFNTAMTGYQEVITDPSYCGQMVLMTYPLIGSYGINAEDMESRQPFLEALLVKEYIDFPSNWRSKQTLKSYLETNGIMGVEGFDTRAITRFLREKGAQRSLLTTSEEPLDVLVERVRNSPSMEGQNLADKVSVTEAYQWNSSFTARHKVAVIDTGVKYNILRHLSAVGCQCTVFPTSVSAETILSGGFDGVFLANGPGDPSAVSQVIQTVRALIGELPIFGICLGHQLLWLALGGSTYKLKFGHHGANHPVRNLLTGQVEITSQNHGFCVDATSIPESDVEITHINLNDMTIEGFRHRRYPIFSVQYHPESAPGPHDSQYLFQRFSELMAQTRDSASSAIAGGLR